MTNLTELERQTISNCMDCGFGRKVHEQVIALMRKNGIEYIESIKLEKIHTFNKWSNGKVVYPSGYAENNNYKKEEGGRFVGQPHWQR